MKQENGQTVEENIQMMRERLKTKANGQNIQLN